MSETYILNQYKIYTSYIGKGSFSRVYKALDTYNNIYVAVKVINKTKIKSNVLEKIQDEINILKSINHPNILKFIEVVNNNNLIYIFTELCETTLKYIKNKNLRPEEVSSASLFLKTHKYTELSMDEIKNIMIQIKDALKYLYNKNIYHRDLKLQNILYNKSTNIIKICDFGFAKIYDDNFLNSTLCGTPHYLAPEILKNNEYHKNSDLWSVGIIYYYLIYNKLPYEHCINILDLTHNINKFDIIYPSLVIDNNLLNLLHLLLNKDPNQRISWNNYFNHIYLQDSNILDESIPQILTSSLAINIQNKLNKDSNKIQNLNIIENYIQSPPIDIKSISVNSYSSSPSITNELYKSLNNSFNKILNLTPPFLVDIKKSLEKLKNPIINETF